LGRKRPATKGPDAFIYANRLITSLESRRKSEGHGEGPNCKRLPGHATILCQGVVARVTPNSVVEALVPFAAMLIRCVDYERVANGLRKGVTGQSAEPKVGIGSLIAVGPAEKALQATTANFTHTYFPHLPLQEVAACTGADPLTGLRIVRRRSNVGTVSHIFGY
jgi:hypothetical protein